MEDQDFLSVEAHLAACNGRAYSPEDKEHIIQTIFACMEAGESMSAACIRLKVTPGTFWRWLRDDLELQKVYDSIKKIRSRVLIEHALFEIQTNSDAKMADMRARHYIRLAALLNPSEFSDKLHAAGAKTGLQGGQTTFVLNFSGMPTHASRELVTIPQSEDSD